MTTEIKLLEKLCDNLESFLNYRKYILDRQDQTYLDLVDSLDKAKLFCEKAERIDKVAAKSTRRKIVKATE